MALNNAQRSQTIRDLVAAVNDGGVFNNISHADMKAAVDAVDQWATDNAAAFNTALPDPFKSTATQAQKALVLAYVCLRRAGL